LADLGYRLTGSASPILPIVIGDAQQTMALSGRLLELGVYAPAIRPPTVPKETSRIRVTVTSEHSRAHLDRALAAFKQAGRELKII
jgi:7-keto-8-aminopelargonate synthetase-like enzyme